MSAVASGPQSDIQTFTIGVLPQIPGFPQLAPDCDLQISVSDAINQKATLKDSSPLELIPIFTGVSSLEIQKKKKKSLEYISLSSLALFDTPPPPVCFLFM